MAMMARENKGICYICEETYSNELFNNIIAGNIS